MTVGEICNRKVVITRPDETVIEAARRMRRFHVGDLIVVDDLEGRRRPIAILTDRDIVVSVLAEDPEDINVLRVGDVATAELVTAREDESLFEAMKKMRSHGIRRLPVVNQEGGLEGILTFDDLVELLSEELSDLSMLVEREQKHERDTRM